MSDLPGEQRLLASLKSCPVFSGLDLPTLRGILMQSYVVDFTPDTPIPHPDKRTRECYLVVSGQVELLEDLGPRGKVLRVVEAGGSFGEPAMWADVPFAEVVQPVGRTVLLAVPRSAAMRVLARGGSAVGAKMIAGLAARLQEHTRRLDQLWRRQLVSARLAQMLARLSQEAQSPAFTLSHQKQVLAVLLGVAAETLSRALSRFCRQSVIRMDGPHIEIIDPQALERLQGPG